MGDALGYGGACVLAGLKFFFSSASKLQVCCPEQIDLFAFLWVHMVKEEIEPKVYGANWGVNVVNAHGQQIDFSQNSSRAVRMGGWAAD